VDGASAGVGRSSAVPCELILKRDQAYPQCSFAR
jgi:hypothetical protein